MQALEADPVDHGRQDDGEEDGDAVVQLGVEGQAEGEEERDLPAPRPPALGLGAEEEVGGGEREDDGVREADVERDQDENEPLLQRREGALTTRREEEPDAEQRREQDVTADHPLVGVGIEVRRVQEAVGTVVQEDVRAELQVRERDVAEDSLPGGVETGFESRRLPRGQGNEKEDRQEAPHPQKERLSGRRQGFERRVASLSVGA